MSKKRQKPFNSTGKESRLVFTVEERADPALEIPIKKAEKAADKLEKAQENIPKKKTLASYLTAKLQVYKESEVQSELRALFDEQYTLTTREEVQVRYRTETRTDTWTDEEGNTHRDTVIRLSRCPSGTRNDFICRTWIFTPSFMNISPSEYPA